MNKLHLRWVVAMILLTVHAYSFAQGTIPSLERNIESLTGTEKLKGYHTLIEHYLERQPKRASKYVRRAEDLSENIIVKRNQLISKDDYYLKPKTYLLAGDFYAIRGFYLESKTAYQRALKEAEAINDAQIQGLAAAGVSRIDSLSSYSDSGKKRFLGPALSDLSTAIDKGTDDFTLNSTLKRAESLEESGDVQGAITNYKALISYYTDRGDWQSVTAMKQKIAELNARMGNIDDALTDLETASDLLEKSGDTTAALAIRAKMDTLETQTVTTVPGRTPIEIQSTGPGGPSEPGITTPELQSSRDKAADIRDIAEKAEDNADYERSLFYFKEYIDLEKKLAEQEKQKELALQQQDYLIENRDREILLLKQNEEIYNLEIDRQESSRKTMAIGLGLLGVVVISIFLLYSNKRRDHRKLGDAYGKLETAQGELNQAQQRIKQLMGQQVSGAVAEALISDNIGQEVARRFVCVMFLDIRNFTGFAEKLLPEEIIDYQNKVFGFMIDAIDRHHGIVNQILGDGFMATFGAPYTHGNDCLNAYQAAREIMDNVASKSESGEIPSTKVGIGIHAGHVVTGNVGTEARKQYSITGNTVIIAARLEQLNKEYGSTLVMSREVYDQLPSTMRQPIDFKPVMVKGRSRPIEVAVFMS